MEKKNILNLKLLKDQVYEYLSGQMSKGELRSGSIINIDETSKILGISRTPLREALLQMEVESFVSLIPRRGVIVNYLTLSDIKNYYQIIGSLEATAIENAFTKIRKQDIKKMENLNKEMEKCIEKDNFDLYYVKNLKYHNIYLDLCENADITKIVNNLKKRLYDFPRPKSFVKEWQKNFILEHYKLVDLFFQGNCNKAAQFIKDVHWSYKLHHNFIKIYYKDVIKNAKE